MVESGLCTASSLVHANLLAGLALQLRIEVHGVPMEALHVDPRVVGGGQAGRVPRGAGGEIALFQ